MLAEAHNNPKGLLMPDASFVILAREWVGAVCIFGLRRGKYITI